MTLTTDEITVINTRLKRYRNWYREVFEELYDHILSLIELKRGMGDKREIALLLEEVIDVDFEGDRGLHRIALSKVGLYRKELWAGLWGYVKYNRVPFYAFSVLILLGSCFIPYSQQLSIVLTTTCFITALVPLAYIVYLKGFKNVFYRPLLKISSIGGYAMYPINMFTVMFIVPFAVRKLADGQSFECPVGLSGIALVGVLTYTIGFIRFCNTEIKLKGA